MADIDLVIRIPEEIYKSSQILDVKHEDVIQIPLEVIANGTPLPKGHGRLIDAYELSRKMYEEAFIKDSDMQRWDSGCWIRYRMFERKMQNAPTILEADKGGE